MESRIGTHHAACRLQAAGPIHTGHAIVPSDGLEVTGKPLFLCFRNRPVHRMVKLHCGIVGHEVTMDVVGSVALLPPILFPTVLVLRARAIISLHGNLVGTFGQPFQILVNHDFATFGIPQFSGCMAGLEVTGIGTAFRPSGQGIVEVRVYKQARHLTRAAFLAQRLDHDGSNVLPCLAASRSSKNFS